MKRQIAENEAERLKVQEMVAKAKARAKVYEESVSGDGKLFPQTEEARPSKQTDIDHYFQRGSHQKLIQDEHLYPKKTDITEVLCNLVKQQSAPDADLDVFDGNPLEYHYFITLFHDLVEKGIEDPRGRLTRLIKYAKGNPKKVIKHCVQQPAAVGYDNAKKLLQQKYGNPYSIMSMYQKEIKTWPKLKNGDGGDFQKFYNFLVKCESITKSREWNPLDTPDVIFMLLSKLHGKIRVRWVRAVTDVRTKEHREGTLGHIIKLIHEKTMLANDPLFTEEAVD